MTKIKIINGTYKIRGVDTSMTGQVFTLVNEFKIGRSGGYVTVNGADTAGFPERNIKIKCDGPEDYEVIDSSSTVTSEKETDEQIIERLRSRFEMLHDMSKAVKQGQVGAMIVSGPPGVGKSYGVEEVLDRYNMVQTLGGEKKYDIVKGAMSPIGLYCKLYNYANEGNVLVFDDCDSIFNDELSLNIMKAALDSNKRRFIHWNTDSFKLRNEGVPDKFEFKGSAIFITNLKFDKVKGKLREHLAALESRCHYIDLTIDTDREKMLRIRQIVNDGMLDNRSFGKETIEEIIDFVDMNKNRLREISLRTVLKCADLAESFPDRWADFAENTVMRR